MKTFLDHMQINVSNAGKSFRFYKDLFQYLGYRMVSEREDHVAFSNGTTDFWIMKTEDSHLEKGFHRKATGLNHLCFHAPSRKEVDDFADRFLKGHNILPLYGTPKPFPEYTTGYYAVFFEDPDRIKIEFAYIPK